MSPSTGEGEEWCGLRRANSISNGEAMRGLLIDGQQEKQRRELAAAAKIMSAVLDDIQVWLKAGYRTSNRLGTHWLEGSCHV